MNFHFNEEEQEILDMLHDYAVKEVAPKLMKLMRKKNSLWKHVMVLLKWV